MDRDRVSSDSRSIELLAHGHIDPVEEVLNRVCPHDDCCCTFLLHLPNTYLVVQVIGTA